MALKMENLRRGRLVSFNPYAEIKQHRMTEVRSDLRNTWAQ